jgi:hypothetical protein
VDARRNPDGTVKAGDPASLDDDAVPARLESARELAIGGSGVVLAGEGGTDLFVGLASG